MKDQLVTPAQVYLSDRQEEVLHLASHGKSKDEIAVIMHLSPHTIKTHRANLMEKLGVTSMVHAVAVALRLGLIK